MYLFDIDGTLLLSGGAGSRAINQLFLQRFGVSGVMDSIVAGGKTDEMILQECAQEHMHRRLSPSELESILEEYVPVLHDEINSSATFRLMPFAGDCLQFLAPRVSALGIATGNIQRAAQVKLEHAGFSHYFDFGGYACDSAVRSELVAKAIERGCEHVGRTIPNNEFVVVGDTPLDIAAARDCGARVIAVATGSFSRQTLAASAPDALFDSLEELPDWHVSTFGLEEY